MDTNNLENKVRAWTVSGGLVVALLGPGSSLGTYLLVISCVYLHGKSSIYSQNVLNGIESSVEDRQAPPSLACMSISQQTSI